MCKGHTHKLIICDPERELYLADDGHDIVHHYRGAGQAQEYIHPDHRYYVNTGSFLKMFEIGHSGYAEIAEYDPVELGFAVAKIRDRQLIGVDPVMP